MTDISVSGKASLAIWSFYANFKSLSLFISFEFDRFHALSQKYLTKFGAGFATALNTAWHITNKINREFKRTEKR